MQILELNLVYETSKGRNQDPTSPHPLSLKHVTCSFATKTVLETLVLPVAINLYGAFFTRPIVKNTKKKPAGRIFEFFPQDTVKTIF